MTRRESFDTEEREKAPRLNNNTGKGGENLVGTFPLEEDRPS